MKLNIEKIKNELERIEKTKYWLAKQIGTSPQLLFYWMKNETIKAAEPIGKVLGISPKDLII
ncbi:XRE family transcriptional regulator [Thermodesulfobacteriota bacterium]